jgi:hypothetical protein
VNSSPKHHPTIENTDYVLEEEFEEKGEEEEEASRVSNQGPQIKAFLQRYLIWTLLDWH